MERLTYRSPKFNNPVSNGACKDITCSGECDSCKINDLIAKLCAYEDTGLSPEEIKVHEAAKYNAGYYHGDEDRCRWIEKELGPIDHLRDLLQAEQDGQLVVLPCKVGDKVRVDARTWGDTWNYKTVDGGKYLLGETVAIIKTRKQTFIKIRVEHNVSWKRPMRRYPISAIGKTVFLTREEAEAAMEQEGGKDHA